MDASLFHGNLVVSSRIIYTPSVFAKTNLIHLQEIGSLKAQKPHVSKRDNLSSYLFFMILSGSGTLEYDGISHELSAGDCVFIDCKKPYFHRSSEDLWTLKWVHFYGPNMGAVYDKYTERGGAVCFHPADLSSYIKIHEQLYETAASESHIRDMKLYEKLTALLSLLMDESWNPPFRRKNASRKQNLQDIKDYLDHNYAHRIRLDDLADQFFINKFYLTRIFKEQFGISVNAYLIQVRITHAKQLLRFSDLPIEKISIECGMNDANYFSRIFKKVEGISPGEYRKQW